MKAWRVYHYVEDFCGLIVYYWAREGLPYKWTGEKEEAKIFYSKRNAHEIIERYKDRTPQLEDINL